MTAGDAGGGGGGGGGNGISGGTRSATTGGGCRGGSGGKGGAGGTGGSGSGGSSFGIAFTGAEPKRDAETNAKIVKGKKGAPGIANGSLPGVEGREELVFKVD